MKIISRSLLLLTSGFLSLTAAIAKPVQLSDAFAKGPSINVGPVETAIEVKPVADRDSAVSPIDSKYKNAVSRLKQQAASLEKYIKANNFNTEYVFLLDMSLPSGKNRFFVYNLKTNEVEQSSLVTHGVGSNRYENDDPLQFSNLPYSMKTSVGKYKIGASYLGKFGLAYKLYGLDSTNSKAYERAIVLHSHKQVPDKEPYPGYIIVSQGCPTVAPAFLNTLDKYIKASKKPILMWIYS